MVTQIGVGQGFAPAVGDDRSLGVADSERVPDCVLLGAGQAEPREDRGELDGERLAVGAREASVARRGRRRAARALRRPSSRACGPTATRGQRLLAHLPAQAQRTLDGDPHRAEGFVRQDLDALALLERAVEAHDLGDLLAR